MSYQDVSRATLQNAAAATGNGTVLEVDGFGGATLQITGTFVATITFEATIDGTNWAEISALNTDGSQQQTATATGLYFISVAGLRRIRARISSYTSGSVTVEGAAIRDALSTMSAVGGLNNPRNITAVAISAAAQLLTTAQGDVVSRAGVFLQPTDGKIYLGASGVTTATGLPVPSGQTIFLEWTQGSAWYAIADSGTVNVRVIPVDR